ncbi:MAG: hypothetical protein LC800_06475 [Acidobacteria bacterium]|nr:hypothetical protein [Acidobacteriota bacterium]
MRRLKTRKVEESLLVAFFLAAVCLPLTVLVLRLDTAPAWENRPLAEFPRRPSSVGELARLPGGLKGYFSDHFGLRSRLIRWQAVAKVHWLGVSSSPKVLLGKEGWLFYSAQGYTETYTRLDPFTDDELARWAQALEARRVWLERRGAAFVVTVAPTKQTIYPEHMPDGIARLPRDSRLDQFIRHLAAHTGVRVLDLRPALVEAKARGRIYYRTDTHWNDAGSFVAYEALARELGKSLPGLRPLPASDFAAEPFTQSGDLAGMLGLHNVLSEEEARLRPRRPPGATFAESDVARNPEAPAPTYVSHRPDASLPRMVMYRDSFSESMRPLLAEHFSRAYFIWDNKRIDPALIESERPAVVVMEMVENTLMTDAPRNPPEIANATAAGHQARVSR